MARPETRDPTEAELEVLGVLWREGPSTMRQIQETLPQALTRPAVHARLDAMIEKGLIRVKPRPKSVGGALYEPVDSKVGMLATVLRRLKRAFGGSSSLIMQGLLNGGQLDEQDVKDIEKLLREHRNRKG